MLLHYDKFRTLYVLGTGVTSQQLKSYISHETDGNVVCVESTEFAGLKDYDQCIVGFINYREHVPALLQKRLSWVTYIHQTAFVDPTAVIGRGTVVLPMAFIDYMTKIGKCCLLSPGSSVGHNAKLGDNCVLCPKTHIGGSTSVGNNFWLGQSATVADKLTISDDVTCVMSSVVSKDIALPGRYYGNRKMSPSGHE